MEKIMNMQAQASTSASPAILRQAQSSVQETKDDFIRLLQQKESAGRPEEAKDAKKTKDVKAEKKPEEKQAEEPVEEQVEETDSDEVAVDLTQMELQQSILQQAVVQMTEPVIAEQQIMADAGTEAVDAVVSEMIQESGKLPLEVSAVPEQPKAEPVKADVRPEPVKTGTDVGRPEIQVDPARAEALKQVTEAPKEEHPDASVAGQGSGNAQTAALEKADPEKTSESFRDDLTDQSMEQTTNMQAVTAPVQAERPQDVPQTSFQEGENTVKSTVEELPQELGKAVTAGRPGDSQVLTVELEPASLGKLTIRLEYEAGRTMVSVMASNPKTLELLSEKASEIASILKEHTGEETVIYTEQPQKEPGEEAQEQGSRGGQQQERQQHRQEEQPQTDSFMQQLRLGLV